MLSPIIAGSLFGTRTLAGMLAGGLVSGVQVAVSMSNTGGAWDNAKKYIEVGGVERCRKSGFPCSYVMAAAQVASCVE
jgi:inorganic pyrophosphatase